MSTATTRQPSTSAKILYRPVGIVSSIVGGLVASMVFRQVWKRVPATSEEAPKALQAEVPFREVLMAALLQGAIFAAVKAVIDRQGARACERATGEWPGTAAD